MKLAQLFKGGGIKLFLLFSSLFGKDNKHTLEGTDSLTKSSVKKDPLTFYLIRIPVLKTA